MKKLVIISHTAHQIHPAYGPVGWSPTIKEINFLAGHWDEIVHVACLETIPPVGSSAPYKGRNIKFIPIPTFGGKNWWQKIDILLKSPVIISRVNRALKNATEVQLRLPMGIGLVLMLYFKIIDNPRLKLWIKYATNWEKSPGSLSYRLQKHLIQRDWLKCPVTINGSWPNQPDHCKSFENPCLTQKQYQLGGNIAKLKSLHPPYTLIFIGRLDANKGIDIIMSSISKWPWSRISKIHFVGEGNLKEPLQQLVSDKNIPAIFHGFIDQSSIFELLKLSHFLVLPSKSEGFPKVIAEGLNFGCLPIASAVGSIPQYIVSGESGQLLSSLDSEGLTKAIDDATRLNPLNHREMVNRGRILSKKFTFEAYLNLLKKEILNVP